MSLITLWDRIDAAMAKKGWNMSRLAEESGVTKQSIHAIKTGKSSAGQSYGALAKALGVDPLWLRDGEGRQPWSTGMTDTELKTALKKYDVSAVIPVDEHTTAGNGRIAANRANGVDQSHFTEALTMKDHWRAVAIHGTSAEPVALDGQHVLVDDNLEAKDGRIVCVTTTDGRFFCKRWCDAGGDHVVLAGLNAGIESVALHRDEIARARVVVGVVFTDSVAR